MFYYYIKKIQYNTNDASLINSIKEFLLYEKLNV